jgi:small-conductance mechanosensitive channel
VLFTLAVPYETPPALLDKLPLLVKEAVAAAPGTNFTYCLLRNLGEYALVYEVVYFVSEPSTGLRYVEVMDTVNRGILAAFDREGLRFAYPTRVVLKEG